MTSQTHSTILMSLLLVQARMQYNQTMEKMGLESLGTLRRANLERQKQDHQFPRRRRNGCVSSPVSSCTDWQRALRLRPLPTQPEILGQLTDLFRPVLDDSVLTDEPLREARRLDQIMITESRCVMFCARPQVSSDLIAETHMLS